MTVIEENTEMTENDQKSSLSQDLTAKIKEASRKSADDISDSDDETIDKIEVNENIENDEVREIRSEDENDEFDDDEHKIESLHEDGNEEIQQTVENFGQIEELINEEIGFYDNIESAVAEELASKEESMRESIERSLSEGKGQRATEFKVLDRSNVPKVMLEYEPSTTEAESGMSDSDTLDTESLNEDFVTMVKSKKNKKNARKDSGTQGTGSLSSDREVARAMADKSPTESRHMVATNDDFHRGSTEPITGDTMGDGESLVDEDGSEVITCAVSQVPA